MPYAQYITGRICVHTPMHDHYRPIKALNSLSLQIHNNLFAFYVGHTAQIFSIKLYLLTNLSLRYAPPHFSFKLSEIGPQSFLERQNESRYPSLLSMAPHDSIIPCYPSQRATTYSHYARIDIRPILFLAISILLSLLSSPTQFCTV